MPEKDGTLFDAEVSASPVTGEDGRYLGMIAAFQDITERKRALEALKASRQQLKDIIDFQPDATFVIDNNKKVIAWNKAMEEMTGVKKEDIIGQGDYAYTIPFYGERRPHILDLIDISDEELKTRYSYIKRKGHTFYAEIFAPALYEGKGAYVWATGAPLFDAHGTRMGAIESIRDVTDVKRAEEALRETKEKYRELVENANSIILRMDSTGVVTFFNEFSQRFFGYAEEEILGKNVIGTIVPPVDSMGFDLKTLIEDIGRNPDRYSTNINENMRRDGERVWIAWTNRPVFDDHGRVTSILCIGNDITVERRTAEAL